MRSGGLPGRRAGDVGAGRARDPPGCIHDRAATPTGTSAMILCTFCFDAVGISSQEKTSRP
jgi:hypothetical protein